MKLDKLDKYTDNLVEQGFPIKNFTWYCGMMTAFAYQTLGLPFEDAVKIIKEDKRPVFIRYLYFRKRHGKKNT